MNNIFEILTFIACAFSVFFAVTMLCLIASKDLKYFSEKHKYGKIEGKIINKYKTLGFRVGAIVPYEYYFEIAKEVDGKTITRKFLVSEFEFSKYEIGDKILKETFKSLRKI